MEEPIRLLYSKGKEAFENKDYDQALEAFTKLTGQVSSFADVWNIMGQIYHHRGELRNAVECFEKSLAVNPAYADARFNLSILYADIGEYEKAEKLYEMARTEPTGEGDQRIPDPYVRGKLANMHTEMGDVYHGLAVYDDAENEYRKALKLRPEFPDVRTKLARVLFDSGKTEEAVAELREVKNKKPAYSPARIQLGVLLYSLGRQEDALREWREILENDPDNEKAKMYLRLVQKNEP